MHTQDPGQGTYGPDRGRHSLAAQTGEGDCGRPCSPTALPGEGDEKGPARPEENNTAGAQPGDSGAAAGSRAAGSRAAGRRGPGNGVQESFPLQGNRRPGPRMGSGSARPTTSPFLERK